MDQEVDHQDQQGMENGGNQEEATVTMLSCLVKLPSGSDIKLVVSVRETPGDIKQSLAELSQSRQFTCFHLEYDGHHLADHVELGNMLPADDNAELVMVEDPYTRREARSHLLRIRELVGFGHSTNGISSGISLCDSLSPIGPDESWDYTETFDLTKFLPTPPEPSPCVKNLGLSQWHPPPPQLAVMGHLLYITVTTLEGEQHNITAHVSGFYINRSSSNKFDPTPRQSPKDQASHSLLGLLLVISPLLKERLQEGLKTVADPLAHIPLHNTVPALPWLVHAPTPSRDAGRAQENQLTAGMEGSDNLRDWNEELQSCRELPQTIIQDRILRERLISKLLSDFTNACIAGATQIAHGDVLPINPAEPFPLHIYLHNNIFFSRGLDGNDIFKGDGGDEAARVAVGKDVVGLRSVHRVDTQDLSTIATVVVDYLGQRIVGQSILPGIFRQREDGDSQIIYGSNESRDSVVCDPTFENLLQKIASALHIKQHNVAVSSGDGKEKSLVTSVDTKGLIGADGRHYLLDLYRLTPLDINFLRTASDYPHRMALLRSELVEEFWRHKLRAWVQAETKRRKEAGEEMNDEKGFDISGFQFALNPDCFLNDFETKTNDDRDVEEASAFLVDHVIPTLVSDFEQQRAGIPIDGAAMTALLHKRGINMRYLGRIASMTTATNLLAARQVAIHEMVARAFKHVANAFIRNLPLPFIPGVLAHLLNCLFGNPSPIAWDQALVGLYNITPETFESSPEKLQARVRDEVQHRFQFELDNIPVGMDVVRQIAQKLGLQLKIRQYILEPPATTNGSTTATHGFKPCDILNILPLHKEARWSSALAEEAFEAGRITVLQGQKDLGKELLLESLTLHEQIHGSVHQEVARTYSQVGQIFYSIAEREAAAELGRKAVIVAERTFGIDAAETILFYLNLSLYEHSCGHTALALAHVRHALTYWKVAFRHPHPDVVTTCNNVAVMMQSMKRFAESRRWFEETLSVCEQIYGKKNLHCATIKYQLAQALVLTQDTHAAVNVMRDAYNIFHAELGKDDKNTKETEQWLETLTHSAVNMAKQSKDLQVRKGKSISKQNISLIQPNGQPPPSTPSIDSRSIDELVKFIGGNDESKPAMNGKVSNPKRRGRKR